MIWVILVVEEEDFEARLSGTTDEGRRRNLHGSGHENRGSAFDVIKTEVFLVRETRSPSSPRTEKERKRKHLNSHLNKVISKDTYVCVHIFKIFVPVGSNGFEVHSALASSSSKRATSTSVANGFMVAKIHRPDMSRLRTIFGDDISIRE